MKSIATRSKLNYFCLRRKLRGGFVAEHGRLPSIVSLSPQPNTFNARRQRCAPWRAPPVGDGFEGFWCRCRMLNHCGRIKPCPAGMCLSERSEERQKRRGKSQQGESKNDADAMGGLNHRRRISPRKNADPSGRVRKNHSTWRKDRAFAGATDLLLGLGRELAVFHREERTRGDGERRVPSRCGRTGAWPRRWWGWRLWRKLSPTSKWKLRESVPDFWSLLGVPSFLFRPCMWPIVAAHVVERAHGDAQERGAHGAENFFRFLRGIRQLNGQRGRGLSSRVSLKLKPAMSTFQPVPHAPDPCSASSFARSSEIRSRLPGHAFLQLLERDPEIIRMPFEAGIVRSIHAHIMPLAAAHQGVHHAQLVEPPPSITLRSSGFLSSSFARSSSTRSGFIRPHITHAIEMSPGTDMIIPEWIILRQDDAVQGQVRRRGHLAFTVEILQDAWCRHPHCATP